MSGRWTLAALITTLGTLATTFSACDGGAGTPVDATVDVAGDSGGMCGSDATFTGANIDWDSTDARFCGVQGATWTVRGDTARTSTTPPNGRFRLCIAHQAQTIVDIAPPLQSSGCLGADGTPYPRRGVAIASDATLARGDFIARSMTRDRELAMFTQVGAGYSASLALLVVHVGDTARAVSINAAHGAAQQFNGTAWSAAADSNAPTGNDVLFPNVAIGAVTVTVAGGGSITFTIEADRFTYVTAP